MLHVHGAGSWQGRWWSGGKHEQSFAETEFPRQAVKAHRIHLLAAAEEDLGKVKRQFFLQLAKDRGVLADYLREVKVLGPDLLGVWALGGSPGILRLQRAGRAPVSGPRAAA